MEKITYTNANGESIEIYQSPYKISSIDGISNAGADIQTETAPYIDGSQLLDVVYGSRLITVEFNIFDDDYFNAHKYRRAISKVFRRIYNSDGEVALGVLRYENDYGVYEIDAFAETVTPSAIEPYLKYQVAFNCPKPYFKAADSEVNVELSYEVGGIEYNLEVPEDGIEFGTVNSTVTINNQSDIDTPVQIIFYGPAENAIIKNNTSGLEIKVNQALAVDEYLIIDTTPGQKSITLVSGGIESSAYNYITADTELWQLLPGENEIEYSSDDNNPNASVTIAYNHLYIGV